MNGRLKTYIETLHRLAHVCLHSRENFEHAIERIDNPNLKDLLTKFAEQRSFFANELREQISNLGGNPDDKLSDFLDNLNQLWMKIRTSLTVSNDDDISILQSIRISEQSVLEIYDDELQGYILETALRPIIINQRTEISKALNEIDYWYFEKFPPKKTQFN